MSDEELAKGLWLVEDVSCSALMAERKRDRGVLDRLRGLLD